MLLVSSVLLVAGLAGCTSSEPGPIEVRALGRAITDGVVDTGHPNVGLLLIDAQGGVAQSICTATVVGKKTLLTAAHCCKPNVNILFQLKTVRQVTKVIPHPSWVSLYKHDIGLAILKDPVTTVSPAEAGTVTPAKGMKVTLVGYGRTSTDDSDSSGTKRKGNNTIYGLGTGYFTVTGTGNGKSNTCKGDSGGPTFTVSGGKERIVGVISSSEGTCGVKSYHVTVKSYLSWLKSASGGDFYQPPVAKQDGSAPKPDSSSAGPDSGGAASDAAGAQGDLQGPAADGTADDGPRASDGCAVGGACPGVGAWVLLLVLVVRRWRGRS